MRKQTILFLAANPIETDRLALDREARAIQLELERSGARDRFKFVTRWAAEPLDLLRELRKLRPTVVHFSGHGGHGAAAALQADTMLSRDILGDLDPHDGERCDGLFFQGPDGRPQIVSARALRDAFGAAGSSVKLVVLNACYSEPVAESLLAYVDFVVGMAGSVRDATARSFAIGFYGGLGERESIAAAHKGGCAAIGLEGLPAADRPRLKARQGADAEKLILASGKDAPPRRAIHSIQGEPAVTAKTLPTRKRAHPQANVFVPLVIAAITGVTGLGLLVLMLGNAQMLVGRGLTGHVWYVLLLLLGLAGAVTIFSLFKSYACYMGKTLGGALELGGPTVVMLLVVILGFYLVPAPAQQFDVTVFLHGEVGPQAVVLRNRGKLSLDLGSDRRIESVGDKGEVRIPGIPANMRGRDVALGLVDDEYELADPTPSIRLNRDVFYAAVRPKRLPLAGYVSDDRGRPLAGACASIAGKTATTGPDGRFEIMLPADLPEGDRTIIITAPGYETWRGQAVPGGNALQLRLSAAARGE